MARSKKVAAKAAPPTPRPLESGDVAGRSFYFALRYPDQEMALPALEALAESLRSAGLGALEARGVEEVRGGERLHLALDGERGSVRIVVHDDESMPAMVVEVTGPSGLALEVAGHVGRRLDVAPAREVIDTAEVERHDDPAMLVLAAWVATEQEDAPLLQLLQRSSLDPDVEVRRAVAKAAAVQCTPALRALVQAMAAKEREKPLARQLQRLLAAWPSARGASR